MARGREGARKLCKAEWEQGLGGEGVKRMEFVEEAGGRVGERAWAGEGVGS